MEGKKLDYEKLFYQAIAEMIDSNGGSLETALDDAGIYDNETREIIKEEFGWDDDSEDDWN